MKDNFNDLYSENIKPKNTRKILRKYGIVTLVSIFSSLLVGVLIGSFITIFQKVNFLKISESLEINSVSVSASYDSSSDEMNIKNIIKNVTPSIVTITTTTTSNNFFNIPIESTGAGSGIIFHTTGTNTYILTNAHVIDGAYQVGIALDSSDPIYASLVGKDVNSDLAVISVLNDDLKKAGITQVTVATFGNSDNMNVGDSVIAIGNALGEGKTATLGIISSTSKDVNLGSKSLTMMQTTAAINPGNSGGALINSSGEVIGINTAKVATTDVNGIGYSISSNIAMPIIERIMNNSNPPALDVYIQDLSTGYGDGFSMGALVVEVINGGSAFKAGILAGDIITAVEDTPIFNSEQLVNEVKSYSVGDVIKVKVLRDEEVLIIKVKLKETVNTSGNF